MVRLQMDSDEQNSVFENLEMARDRGEYAKVFDSRDGAFELAMDMMKIATAEITSSKLIEKQWTDDTNG